jgi:hypothetical protein
MVNYIADQRVEDAEPESAHYQVSQHRAKSIEDCQSIQTLTHLKIQ